LILWNDDLARVGIVRVLDRVAQDADYPNHLADLRYAVRDVAGVADELFAASDLRRQRDLE